MAERRSIRLLSALISGKLMYFDTKYCLKSERGGCVIGEIALVCIVHFASSPMTGFFIIQI